MTDEAGAAGDPGWRDRELRRARAAVLLAPHNDDETLFAAYTILGRNPDVVIVTRGDDDPLVRAVETQAAMDVLGAGDRLTMWNHDPAGVRWDVVKAEVEELATRYDVCFAPAIELGGHEQHTHVGVIAEDVFGSRVRPYMTYVRGRGRSTSRVESVPEHGWRALKLRAMSCYVSQIERENTRAWFDGRAGDPLREWYE